ncbi:MAG: thymidine phosphorylase [Gemmatimonadota bacterium]
MIPQQLIRKKREGEELLPNELADFLRAYIEGRVTEYQMAAFLMAVFFRGMSTRELTTMVDVMLNSGTVLDLSGLGGRSVDKHSIGGVGDKVSIILAPLVASLGVNVPMMSGRGLGHTGGTVDKLESIPGFKTALPLDRFRAQLEKLHCALISPTESIAPLDKRLYALRDVTGTVESIPLIASSIMSKKLAEGITGLVLDIKDGSGSFMPEQHRALELAQTMIAIGEGHNCRTVALVTAMDRPLGYAIGNAIEMEEAILTLRGEGPPDLVAVTLWLAAEMLLLAAAEADRKVAYQSAKRALEDGRALEKMRQVIDAQGGNPTVLDDPAVLPQGPIRRVFEAERAGYVGEMQVREIGEAAVALGAGRAALGSEIDVAVGFYLTAKPGQQVSKGEPLASIYARSEDKAAIALSALQHAIPIVDVRVTPLPLISHRVTARGIEELT